MVSCDPLFAYFDPFWLKGEDEIRLNGSIDPYRRISILLTPGEEEGRDYLNISFTIVKNFLPYK